MAPDESDESSGAVAVVGEGRGCAGESNSEEEEEDDIGKADDSESDSDSDSVDQRARFGGPRSGVRPATSSRFHRHPGLPPWVRTLSDSFMVVRGGGRIVATPQLRSNSLPAVLTEPPDAPEDSDDEKRPSGNSRGLRLSQAVLIIPRTVSEYFECCRYVRSHSGGLLMAHIRHPEDSTFVQAQKSVPPRAISEPPRRPRPSSPSRDDGPPPRVPVEKLKQGSRLEGRIMRVAGIGLFVDVGATKLGLLRRKDCKGVPKRLLQRNEVLSNLTVLDVDVEKGRFSLGVKCVDGSNVQELAYLAVLQRIAGWASVELPQPMLDHAAQLTQSVLKGTAAREAAMMSPRRRKGARAMLPKVAELEKPEAVATGRGRREGNAGAGASVRQRLRNPSSASTTSSVSSPHGKGSGKGKSDTPRKGRRASKSLDDGTDVIKVKV